MLRELPPLDFNPDPKVVARTRVALILNKDRLNQRDAYRTERMEEIAIERALEEFQ